MVFPKTHIKELKKQTGRDLTRFDLDFDLPDHLLADFPAAIYLTTRTDLGDVSANEDVTIDFIQQFLPEVNRKLFKPSADAVAAK